MQPVMWLPGRFEGLHLERDTPAVEDVAHCLSREPRWNGATVIRYTVLDHLWNCLAFARKVSPCPIFLLNVLLHDVEECAFHDVTRGLKHLPCMAEYVGLSVQFRHRCFAEWGIPWDQDDLRVKYVDDAVGDTERTEMLVNGRGVALRHSVTVGQFMSAYSSLRSNLA